MLGVPERRVAAHPLGVESLAEWSAVTNDDLVFRSRMGPFARAGETAVTTACREVRYHRTWYYP